MRIWIGVMVLVAAALISFSSPKVSAHGTCLNSWCCAPHGGSQNATGGCYFGVYGGCDYDAPNHIWYRDVTCLTGSSEANNNCGYPNRMCTYADADQNHNVHAQETYGFYCVGAGQNC